MAIYARLENGTYAEVTGVYKTDGTEITEIFQGDRLVYSATNEIYGTVPLYYDGLGYELIDYLISGNAVQDGTPSPDAPVDVTGSGVRTGNLFDASNTLNGARIGAAGEVVADSSCVLSGYIPVLPNESYSQSTRFSYSNALAEFDENKEFIKRYVSGNRTITTSENTRFVRVSCAKTLVDSFMLNLGSTALPYEPYGYKLPLTVNGTEYPIYLGQVETTRRVKKFVLTGEETPNVANSTTEQGTKVFSFKFTAIGMTDILDYNKKMSSIPYPFFYSSHFKQKSNTDVYTDIKNGEVGSNSVVGDTYNRYIIFGSSKYTTVSDFKSYLAQQYANGTPVTVWYVLAEPETAVVNEPLMKIGDYADTISFAQAGVTIPTVNGANVLDMASTVKPSEVYVKGKGIKQNRGQS